MLAVLATALLIDHAATVAHGVNPGVFDHHKQPLIPTLSVHSHHCSTQLAQESRPFLRTCHAIC